MCECDMYWDSMFHFLCVCENPALVGKVNMNRKYRYVLAKIRCGILSLEIETGTKQKNVDLSVVSH